jgi:hypothetical protein
MTFLLTGTVISRKRAYPRIVSLRLGSISLKASSSTSSTSFSEVFSEVFLKAFSEAFSKAPSEAFSALIICLISLNSRSYPIYNIHFTKAFIVGRCSNALVRS